MVASINMRSLTSFGIFRFSKLHLKKQAVEAGRGSKIYTGTERRAQVLDPDRRRSVRGTGQGAGLEKLRNL